MVDQSRQHIDDIRAAGSDRWTTDRIHRGERELSGENGERREQHTLVRQEQIVAPVERSLERLMPRRSPAPLSQQLDGTIDALGDLLRCQDVHPPRGELNRKRPTGGRTADGNNRGSVWIREGKERRYRLCALHEQTYRFRGGRVLVRLQPIRHGEWREDPCCLAGHAQWLAAGRQDFEMWTVTQQL